MAQLYIACGNIGTLRQSQLAEQQKASCVASYHFAAQIIRRSQGRSAIAAAAYRAGERLRDHEAARDWNFTRRRGVEHTEILLPEGAALWLADRQCLWAHASRIETRKDAQLAREIIAALPHELPTKDENSF
jgi:MobA/MobL family protein